MFAQSNGLAQDITKRIEQNAYAFVPSQTIPLVEEEGVEFQEFRNSYNRMGEDRHLNKGEGERSRFYARLMIDPKTLELYAFPHDKFYQSKTYDVLYGDIHREFPPAPPEVLSNRFFQRLLQQNFASFPIPESAKNEMYEISVHMIRIAATPGNRLGRPAPEGIHRDGYHYAAIHLMKRENLKGAQNRIHDLSKKVIDRETFLTPMDSCLFDDRRIFHSVQPFSQVDEEASACRDMLILLYQPLSESPQKLQTPIPLI